RSSSFHIWDSSYRHSRGLIADYFERLSGVRGKIKDRYIRFAYYEILHPRGHDRFPTLTQQHERATADNPGLKLIPYQRNLRNRAHAAAKSYKSNRTRDQILEAVIKMVGRDLVGKIPIRLGLELVHHDPEHTTAAFAGPFRRCLHDPQIAA